MENIIKAMTKKLREKLGESDVEKSSVVWKEFANIKLDELTSKLGLMVKFGPAN